MLFARRRTGALRKVFGRAGHEAAYVSTQEPNWQRVLSTGIERAIIDKNARIGDNVHISPEGKPENYDGDNYNIRDGIVVVPKGGVIRSGTVV